MAVQPQIRIIQEYEVGGCRSTAGDGEWLACKCATDMANDHPPTGDEDFLAFARTLPMDRLYEAIKDAQPLTSVHG